MVQFFVRGSAERRSLIEQLVSDAAEGPNINPGVILDIFVFEGWFKVGI